MASTRRDGIARRAALLDAALECFAELGVFRTGIEEIRKRAGASPSSVYHFFGGLEDLTVALLLRTFERLFAHLEARVARAETAEGAVRALVDGHLEWVLAHRAEARFMYEATSLELGPRAAEDLRTKKAGLLAPVARHVARFAADGSLPPWPPETLDVVLLGASHEACRRLLAGAPLDPAWMRATLPVIAWKSVAGMTASLEPTPKPTPTPASTPTPQPTPEPTRKPTRRKPKRATREGG